jgi:hypothetical protein
MSVPGGRSDANEESAPVVCREKTRRRPGWTTGLRRFIKGGIFPDSIGIQAHRLVLLRPIPVWSFLGAPPHLRHLARFCVGLWAPH